ncbi:MAG: hypothetical protein EAX96_16770 [Candidatus Lokiarchaeota archaeon]|nr:hypothetical protein [Candidatus Lokiarchaeota archaeon]
MVKIIGWDIGGVNSKAALINYEKGKFKEINLCSKYFPIFKHRRNEFFDELREINTEIAKDEKIKIMAVTITAELSDAFFNKKEGLNFIIKCFNECFPETDIFFLNNKGNFLSYNEISDKILTLAATNWIATAYLVSKNINNCLIIDIGSTTTDIIPILNGKLSTASLTDLDRLISGELVYTGLLRATIPSIIHNLEIKGKKSRISFEKFALMADIHLVLNHISEQEYTCETADDRPKNYLNSLARISRVVCADNEMLKEEEILNLAKQLYEAQVKIIKDAIEQVIEKYQAFQDRNFPIVVLGLGGKILGEIAAKRLGFININYLSNILGDEGSKVAPSVAVAFMLGDKMRL